LGEEEVRGGGTGSKERKEFIKRHKERTSLLGKGWEGGGRRGVIGCSKTKKEGLGGI